jgi:hypothetical protein
MLHCIVTMCAVRIPYSQPASQTARQPDRRTDTTAVDSTAFAAGERCLLSRPAAAAAAALAAAYCAVELPVATQRLAHDRSGGLMSMTVSPRTKRKGMARFWDCRHRQHEIVCRQQEWEC